MEIILVNMISTLTLLLVHWFPWPMINHGKPLPRLAAYALGTLGMMLPVTGALIWMEISDLEIEGWRVITMIWSVMISGGMVISLANWFDIWSETRSRANEAEEREQTLMKQVERKTS